MLNIEACACKARLQHTKRLEADGVGIAGVGQKKKNRKENNQNYCASDAPSLRFSYVSKTWEMVFTSLKLPTKS